MIRESQRRRYAKVELVDEVIALDEEWRKAQFNYESARKELNQTQKAVGERKKKDKTDACEDLIAVKTELENKIKTLEVESSQKKEQLEVTLKKIGNIVHDTVVVNNNEDFNGVVRTWGDDIKRVIKIDETPGAAHHH